MATTQDDGIADLQRAIAELRQERDTARVERDTALAQRSTEFDERIGHQAATIDVLKAMSASPGDPQPVFDLIVRRAQELCNSKAAGIFEYDGELVHVRSDYGARDIAGAATYFAAFPMKPIRGSFACRAILDKQVIHIRDFAAEPELLPIVRDLGIRSTLAIPLLRDGAAIGAFVINSIGTGGFSDSQVALSETFAEQAVIAINSSETYRTLEQRTADLAQRNTDYSERIEHQAATIDVLKVMSASPDDPQPVFDLIVRQAQAQCNSANAALYVYDGMIHCRSIVSSVLSNDALEAYVRRFPMPLEQELDNGVAVSIRDQQIVHVRDASAEQGVMSEFARSLGIQSAIAVPLIRTSGAVGCILLSETRIGGYSDSQVELLKTFAEQAVIAISSTILNCRNTNGSNAR